GFGAWAAWAGVGDVDAGVLEADDDVVDEVRLRFDFGFLQRGVDIAIADLAFARVRLLDQRGDDFGDFGTGRGRLTFVTGGASGFGGGSCRILGRTTGTAWDAHRRGFFGWRGFGCFRVLGGFFGCFGV